MKGSNQDLYSEYQEFMEKQLDIELVALFNREATIRAWVSSRGLYLQALRREMIRRGIDLSAFGGPDHLNYRGVARLEDGKLVPVEN